MIWRRDDEDPVDEPKGEASTGDPPTIELDAEDSAVTELESEPSGPKGKRFQPDRTRPAPTLPPLSFDSSASGVSGSLAARPSVFTLGRAGARALRHFPGLCGSIYLVQVGISFAAAAVMGLLLSDAFAHRPLFDRAIDGDLTALIQCFRDRPGLLTSLLLVGSSAVVLYWLVSLFMTAGLIAVLLDPPTRRREVARWFGAGGAANFFPLLRLSLWSILPYSAVVVSIGIGADRLPDSLESTVSASELAVPLALAVGVPLLLNWIIGTAVDYARIDLVRHPGMSTLRALVRGFRVLWTRPLVLVHTALYGLFFIAVSAGYVAVSGSLAEGLVAAILVRQLLALVRFLAHVMLIAGQVELACSLMAAPLRRRFS